MRQGLAGGSELFADFVVKTKVDQVVAEKLADQELGGDIVDFLLAFVIALLADVVLYHLQKRVIDFKVGAFHDRLRQKILNFFGFHIVASLRRSAPLISPDLSGICRTFLFQMFSAATPFSLRKQNTKFFEIFLAQSYHRIVKYYQIYFGFNIFMLHASM